MWRKLTEADLTAAMRTQEIEIYRQSGGWKSDPVVEILKQTAAMVRSYIRTNGKSAMSPNADEVPESCVSHCANYAAYMLCIRNGGKVTADRTKAKDAADKFFSSISRRWIVVEDYGGEEGGQGAGPSVEVVQKEPSKLGNLGGL